MSAKAQVWEIYMVAAPLINGTTAFKVGRTSSFRESYKHLVLGSPIAIAKAWTLPVVDYRSARMAESKMLGSLAKYRSHGSWLRVSTTDIKARAEFKAAMDGVAKHCSIMGNRQVCWREIKVGLLVARENRKF